MESGYKSQYLKLVTPTADSSHGYPTTVAGELGFDSIFGR